MANHQRKRIYISGPLTADDICEMIVNVRTAKQAARDLIDAGFGPFCPHLTYYLQECGWSASHDDWLAVDLRWVDVSEAVLMLAGWEFSPGARMEKLRAARNSIPICFSVKAIKALFQNNEPIT